jgi:cold-shock-like DNA binding protein
MRLICSARIVIQLGFPVTGKSFMATGTVKWFNSQKGFGFIQPETAGKDVFVDVGAAEQAGSRGKVRSGANGLKQSDLERAVRRAVDRTNNKLAL